MADGCLQRRRPAAHRPASDRSGVPRVRGRLEIGQMRRPSKSFWRRSAAEQDAFLRELLLIDVAYRRQLGQQPTAEEYEARFPGHGQLIGAALSHESASAEQDRRGAELDGDGSPGPLASAAVPSSDARAGRPIGPFRDSQAVGSRRNGQCLPCPRHGTGHRRGDQGAAQGQARVEGDHGSLAQEARNVVELDHPSIVRVHYLGRDEAMTGRLW